MEWFTFMIASLACFRLSRLFSDDKIFDWLRAWVIKEVPKGKVKTKVRQGISCAFCWSFWFSSLISFGLFWLGAVTLPWLWLWVLAIWGASVLENQLFVYLSNGGNA